MPADLTITSGARNWFLAYAGVVVLSVFLGIVTREPLLFGLPMALLLLFQTIVDFKVVFFLLLACIPISIEFYFAGSFGTDLPTEPLMVGLMLVYFLYALGKKDKFDSDFAFHPVIILLLLHLCWTLVTVVNSTLFLVSFKFFLAKLWYVTVFVFLTGIIIRDNSDFKKMFWWIFVPLLLALLFTLFRQYLHGFSFEHVHESMKPMFRNHVNYAALLTLFTPFIWFARTWYEKWSFKWTLLTVSVLIFVAGIYLSYTRAAYIALVLAFGSYLVFQFRLIKPLLAVSVAVVIFGLTYLVQNNNYLEYAPDYNKAITHYQFDDLLEATYNFEDISTMERAYRWVAAGHMVRDGWLTGFGPGNFYNSYAPYTVKTFQTYVSDNEDKSGLHNYYFMILIDQGVPGFLIFIGLVFLFLIYGEKIFHETVNPERKNIVLAVLMSSVSIYAFLIINDLVETDKVGAFFFINIAVLVNMDIANRKERQVIQLDSNSETES